jgi:DNA-binding transcriptional LysR family regulator
VLDETARSKGFALQAVVEADSLRVQKELVAHSPGLYAVLGPFSMAEELRAGALQAARIVSPDLRRYVTLALPKQGQLTPAAKVVARLIGETDEPWGSLPGEPE